MENQPKKLRLEDIKVESFVTESGSNSDTIRGGTWNSNCWGSTVCTNGMICSDYSVCPVQRCRDAASTPHCSNLFCD